MLFCVVWCCFALHCVVLCCVVIYYIVLLDNILIEKFRVNIMKNVVYARYITTLSKFILFSFVLISRYKLFNCNGSYFYISYLLWIYVLTPVCRARSGLAPPFLTIP